MLVFRGVAAADVAANQAQAQMHPGVAGFEALFAALAAGRDFADFAGVRTWSLCGRHRFSNLEDAV
jgi:hypothetical protein